MRRSRDKDDYKRDPELLRGLTSVDYKDAELLKKFMTDRGKILPGRITGTNAQQQRQQIGPARTQRRAHVSVRQQRLEQRMRQRRTQPIGDEHAHGHRRHHRQETQHIVARHGRHHVGLAHDRPVARVAGGI